MANQKRTAIRTIHKSIASNFIIFLVKLLSGIFGHSYALIADAIESLSDVVSSILVLFGLRYAHKPADKNHPYGHGKAEPLFTIIVVIFLIVSALIIIVQSIENIKTPHQLPSKFTLLVLAVIIISKELLFQYIYKKGNLIESSSLKADAWHHRADAITSVTAFIGISLALFMGPGYEAADDYAALFAALLILYNAFKLLKPALSELMDENLYQELQESVSHEALTVDQALEVEKCHIRKHGIYYYLDIHLIVPGELSVRQGHEVSHLVKDAIQEKFPNIAEIMIHIEPD